MILQAAPLFPKEGWFVMSHASHWWKKHEKSTYIIHHHDITFKSQPRKRRCYQFKWPHVESNKNQDSWVVQNIASIHSPRWIHLLVTHVIVKQGAPLACSLVELYMESFVPHVLIRISKFCHTFLGSHHWPTRISWFILEVVFARTLMIVGPKNL